MRQTSLLITVSLFLLFILVFLNLFSGSVSFSMAEVVAALTGGETSDTVRFIVVESRLPQAVTAMLSGAALAVSGLMMQTVFQNPLADPSILGVNSGASLGVAVVMLLLGGSVLTAGSVAGGFLLIVLAAFSGALLIIVLLLVFANHVRSNTTLLIVGIMVSYVTSSAISLLNYYATEQGVHSYVMWGLGNFGGVNLKVLPYFSVVVVGCIVLGVSLIKPLNALLLGNRYAENLGVDVRRTRSLMLFVTGMVSAVVTAFCGPVSFVGLAVSHIARLLSRSANHLVLVPLTLLIGADLGLACNRICSLPSDGTLIPLNVITPLFGVPVILYVLLRRR